MPKKSILSGAFLIVYLPVAWASDCTVTVTNSNDSGEGSFRAALISANNTPGIDTLCFQIGRGIQTITITQAKPLPAITDPIIIDGTSQPGYLNTPIIELNGALAGSVNGLQLSAGNSIIQGLSITGFFGDGLLIDSKGGNRIIGNHIGIDMTGTLGKGNGAMTGSSGIGILSSNNQIGGSTTTERNIVSGNGGNGIVISNGSTGNQVKGNYVGTDVTGMVAIPNGADGLLIVSAPGNIVGGTEGVTPLGACTGACNLFSGNGANGLGVWKEEASENIIQGNFIGLNVNGTQALPNQDIGLEIQDAPNNIVGGLTGYERNVLSGNYGAGLSLTGRLASGNRIQGNFIGTDSSGSIAVKNHKMGVNIGSPSLNGDDNNAHHNVIGGDESTTPYRDCSGACNLISGNDWSGVYISGSTGGYNILSGNYIGTDVHGDLALPNQQDGIGMLNSPGNIIGGTNLCARNIISGNKGNGIAIIGPGSIGNTIKQNYIGLATDKNTLPNVVTGVAVAEGIDTAVLTNSIYGNGYLGIDLGLNGITFNDKGDLDEGSNRLQNYPILNSASTQNEVVFINGVLNSVPQFTYRVEFFSSPTCNADGNGQGYRYLGHTFLTPDSSGNANFTFQTVRIPETGHVITATATKMWQGVDYETSEYSACLTYSATNAAQAIDSQGELDRVFNWGEATYPQLLSPSNQTSQCSQGYYFRYYPDTNTYLGSKEGRIYYYDPVNNPDQINDVGSVEDFLPAVTQTGF